ncbi:NAD(P)H-quinone oxidoreductase [Kocuria rhizophila]|uniref:NAD(P)H-quinone oxidoreductase n=1 Tax=Kocuria TaxID=57493 RepID=UPI000DD37869|nr:MULTISPECIES: NAD(P)H-quinone oxidoreductase [Kocuria]MDV5999787.1 NAD(P)H-quinone oxidoreductase [Kocuria rhizophila]
MRAVRDLESGGPEVLTVSEVPEPELTAGGVLIEVAAAGLNRADVLQRQGHYPVPPDATDVFGLEVSGTVLELGEDVPADAGLSVGDPVVALVDSGGYAERVLAPWPQVLPLPEGVDPVAAAGLPEVAATVFSNVFMAAAAREGETLLVHGGAGGIGTHAIQVARALGMTVLATVGSEEKARVVEELGATPIRYRDEDFVARVEELTDGRGADVILDVVGAKYLDPNLRAVATNGRIVIIGMQGGATGELHVGRLLQKRAAVIGTTLRARPAAEKAAIMAAVREHVWPLVAAGRVRPLVSRTFPLEQVREAHEYFDSGSHVGKVLLSM